MSIIQFPQTVGVESILQTLGVPVRFIEPDNNTLYEHELGVTYKIPDKNIYRVFIRSGMSVAQTQMTLCHELGHIALGHLVKEKFHYLTVDQREKEAEQFASIVLPYIYKPVFRSDYNGEID